jgi:hypothetical protein
MTEHPAHRRPGSRARLAALSRFVLSNSLLISSHAWRTNRHLTGLQRSSYVIDDTASYSKRIYEAVLV